MVYHMISNSREAAGGAQIAQTIMLPLKTTFSPARGLSTTGGVEATA